MPIDVARAFIGSLGPAIEDVVHVPIADALGRVLARDIEAPMDVPPFANSAMDGYALDSSSRGPLRVIGTAHAGRPFDGNVSENECVRILTGAMIPRGCNAVVKQEDVRRDGDTVELGALAIQNENIRPAGEDLARGSIVQKRGRILRPADLGVLASLGMKDVEVVRRVRVGIFTTGDELAQGGTLAPGQLYDSNRVLLCALVTRAGAEAIDLGHVGDDETAMRALVTQHASSCDLILSTGGVAVGDTDCVSRALGAKSIEVAMKPGRHLAVANIGRCAFVGLPGNPVAVAATFHALVARMIDTMTGAHRDLMTLRARLSGSVRNTRARFDYHRGIYAREGDALVVKSTGHQGAGILRSLAEANCFILVPPDAGTLAAGTMVDIEPFQGIERL